MIRAVLDSNIVYAALRSRRGAAFAILSLIGKGQFITCLSVPLVLEYEAVALRLLETDTPISEVDIHIAIDFLCSESELCEIHYLVRPVLNDPDEEMVLELAVNANCQYIVTHNVRDFRGTEIYDVEAITPGQFLELLRK
jgi:putative PIN family toxin of toxin-antitoxin system